MYTPGLLMFTFPGIVNLMIGLYAQDSVLGISKDTNWPIYRPALPSEAN